MADAILSVRGLTRLFGGLAAVSQVTFDLHEGEILGLIGPNGAGKSTMFNLITGVLPLSGGEIRFRGERIDRLPSRRIVRRGIARTFQHVHIRPTMSVVENVAIGAHLRGHKGVVAAALRRERREEATLLHEARNQLERVGLGEHLYEQAGSLALGQQRILEIARALCADPVLLLLDEPAAGLRYREKQSLADLLRRLKGEGMSVLLVEHDMDFVMNLVDRLVVMDFGERIAAGLPREIQTNGAVLEAYLGGVE
jgi:branched-chain amino acid transport system permease protein